MKSRSPLWEHISKVVITDQFTTEYMEVLKRYDIKARLVNKMTDRDIETISDDTKKS